MTLKDYVSRQPQSQLLKEGDHIVQLLQVAETNSFTKLRGMKEDGLKDKLPEWINPSDQIAIMVRNEEGVFVHRLNTKGDKRYTQLSDAELQTGGFKDCGGFACRITDEGLVRVEDPDRTAKCDNIMHSFLWAIGAEEGTNGQDAVDNAIAKGTKFQVTIVKEPWEDTEQYRIARFTRIEKTAEKPAVDIEA